MPWENKRFELFLPVTVVCLMIVGLLALYSATRDLGLSFVRKQLVWDVLGVGAMFSMLFVRERYLKIAGKALYFVSLFLLVMVLFYGTVSGGARRWFDLRFGYFQPSEFARLALLVLNATLLAEPNRKNFYSSFFLTMICVGLVAIEPDLGTALLMAGIWFSMALASQVKIKRLLKVVAVISVMAVLFFFFGLKDYQKDRITSFLNPGRYAQGSAYNMLQSIHTVGSGGLLGRGFLKGPATRLKFVPKNHTDFIFSVIGEEFGFLGTLVLLVLYFVVCWRIVRAVKLAKDEFWRLLCVGALATFSLQVFINIGMCMGVAPVTGLPLPFVSYGGSATLFLSIHIGLVMKSIAIAKSGVEIQV
ncbi:rod shape-determining protein RodA [Pseudothermotoga hypogea DSM 11164 = NBRC 106472]|uniref:Rod shape-determining protein RodA n=1 Tax=Pseudothermotoga hypogea DSM 11164 = NBRC 106472 TaxID=1123384 RepID=A0A0X1KRD8_9THEM|nr:MULTISPECIES: rod shape-determining protein RodA [Pseudothermotoga]AJC73877.1 rod shape-determining protein RodA [Pseudothermotoga hypogea DSM 11164 = NBRC 106472]MBC7122797.1 rod shape-determining protein RodA [Pseudothermotoga sp.]MDI6862313.1 rod shape-determining protein RodA [Pseudothermotoga sp.]